MNNISLRIFSLFVLIVSCLYLPVWTTVLLAVLFCIFFEQPYESIAIGYALDILYGIPRDTIVLQHVFLISFLLIFLLSFWIRDRFKVEL